MHLIRNLILLLLLCSMAKPALAQTAADTATARMLGDSAGRRMDAGDFHAAIDLYTLQMKTGLKLWTFWYNRANAQSYLQNFYEAAKDYDTCLKMDSTVALAYMNRGYMNMKMYKVEDAFKDYATGLRMAHDSDTRAKLYISRGNAYMALNKFAEAEPDFGAAIVIDPKNFQARLQRGAVRRKLKKYKEAIEDLNMGYKLDSKSPELLLLRGIVKFESGAYKPAITDLTASLKLRKGNETWFYRGLAHMKLGQDSLAREDFNKILANDKKNIGAYNSRGEANFKMKHPKLAIKDYTSVIELMPNGGEAYANRAYVYTQIGEKDKACADWHKAAALGIPAAKAAVKKFCGK